MEKAEKRKVVLGITGSVAAYKSVELARLLASRGYEVRCVMTDSAQKFVTSTLLQSVTGKRVITDFWTDHETENIEHIEIADWADAFIIAPATADVIAKLAYGFADSPLLASALATKAPILVAPAMNVNMFEHPKTQENIEVLRARGVEIVPPEEGALACGWNGTGRLADPKHLFYSIRRLLSSGDYKGKKVLVTTGPTREPIDPVRFISNRSSGKMGVEIAREAYARGADVKLVHGRCAIDVPGDVETIPITTAEEMKLAVLSNTFESDWKPDLVIMTAAVSDFRPKAQMDKKIKKSSELSSIELTKNDDIISLVGEKRGGAKMPTLVGFAVETGELEELIEEARNKLESKKLDMIVGNFAEDAFDLDTNRVWIINKSGKQEEVATTFKSRIANKILDSAIKL